MVGEVFSILLMCGSVQTLKQKTGNSFLFVAARADRSVCRLSTWSELTKPSQDHIHQPVATPIGWGGGDKEMSFPGLRLDSVVLASMWLFRHGLLPSVSRPLKTPPQRDRGTRMGRSPE